MPWLVLIPCQANYLSTKGLKLLMGSVAKVRRQINLALKIDGILLTMVDNRTNNAKSIIGALRQTGSYLRVLNTEIPFSVRAAECSVEGKRIFAHDSKGKVAVAYTALVKEVIALEQRNRDRSGPDEAYNDLVSTQAERDNAQRSYVTDLPTTGISDFPSHPFKVRMDEEMERLVDSVKERGILSPVLVRPMPGFSGIHAVCGTAFGSVDAAFELDGTRVEVPAGTAHFLEHKMFESEEGDAFALYAATGASANAFTSFDKTCYLFTCTDRFEENLAILLGLVGHLCAAFLTVLGG